MMEQRNCMELLLPEWEKKMLVVGDCKFPSLKRHLGPKNTNWLASWGWADLAPPHSFLPEVSGWQFPRSRLRLKTGLGTMAIWNLWLLQTRCLGKQQIQQPEELDPLDPLEFLPWRFVHVGLKHNQASVWQDWSQKTFGQVNMGYNGLAGKFPARKWPIVLKLSNFSYDGHFVISPILSRHGWWTSSDGEAEALPWGHIFCWRWGKWISSTLESRDLRDFERFRQQIGFRKWTNDGFAWFLAKHATNDGLKRPL